MTRADGSDHTLCSTGPWPELVACEAGVLHSSKQSLAVREATDRDEEPGVS